MAEGCKDLGGPAEGCPLEVVGGVLGARICTEAATAIDLAMVRTEPSDSVPGMTVGRTSADVRVDAVRKSPPVREAGAAACAAMRGALNVP